MAPSTSLFPTPSLPVLAPPPLAPRVVGLTPTGKKIALGLGLLIAIGITVKVIAGHHR
jgi:hypothetical protein